MSSPRLRPLLLIVFCLLLLLPSKEQTPTNGYSITHYNSDNGLSQNSINAMTFDKNGFLWLATKMGIIRFDGKNFREYNTENSPALLWNEYTLPQRAPGKNKIIEAIQYAFTTRIIITDAGDCMDKELVASILDKSYNPSRHGMGWGYKIIIEILGRLQGTLDIVSGNNGQGNIITITFENKR